MAPDEVRALMHRMAAASNAGDPEAVAACYAEDGVVESPSTGLLHGRLQIRRAAEHWRSAFPDFVMTIERAVAEHDLAAVTVSIAGTHDGEFLGLPPTGRRFEFRGVFLRKIANGLVAHEQRIYDFNGLLIKLGVLKIRPM